ncbi:ACT domain-containing protein [Roseibium aggregatum]|uniref:ACT domain-containing protein n=1 Tax=Roseibium aggregatum TaxID=187304 RepID=A0A939EDS9_9HYPH|nr:ACT domain-containing protein [Roseibium aggregatum]MBN9670896.1 ACT domain-containing protein [Roseibium aggregatum]
MKTQSNGETDLERLISKMRPVLDPLRYVFCSFPEKTMSELAVYDPAGLIAEKEGMTAIFTAEQANEMGLSEQVVFRRITLTVHSSLEAVGLTAAVSRVLAAKGISANVVAAFYHDHVFVPEARSKDAMDALRELSAGG